MTRPPPTYPQAPGDKDRRHADDVTDMDGRRRPAVHYIGFRGDEYHAALRIFGPPDFIHFGWDRWARQEVAPGDIAIFARGTIDDPPSAYSFPDVHE